MNETAVWYSYKELQVIKIHDLEVGRKHMANIDDRIKTAVKNMQQTSDNASFQKLSDTKYELKKAKRHIQNEMRNIVLAKRRAQNE